MDTILIAKHKALQERLLLRENSILYINRNTLSYEEKENDELTIVMNNIQALWSIISFDSYSDRIEECKKLSQLIDVAHKLLDNEGWERKEKQNET